MQKKFNVTVVGGGNMGAALAADISQRHDVSLLTNHPERWTKDFVSIDTENGNTIRAHLKEISSHPEDVIPKAEVVVITLPAFCREQAILRIEPYLKSEALICFMPGTGGVEFYVEKLLQRGTSVVGFDRVTHVARIFECGKSVYVAKKKKVRFGTLGCRLANIEEIIQSVFAIDADRLSNYLSVTFTPSNPILHTSRLFDLWLGKSSSFLFEKNPLFYAEWTDLASQILLGCDDELQAICSKIDSFNLLPKIETIFLREHYESRNTTELTKKLTSIASLSQIKSPMIKVSNGYLMDKNSRYFKEDFPYGLQILIAFAEKFGIETPYMNKVNFWFKSECCLDFNQKSFPVRTIEEKSQESLLRFYAKWQ